MFFLIGIPRARSQWALRDLNRKCQIAVGTQWQHPNANSPTLK